MAHYLVRAQPRPDRLWELRGRLDDEDILDLQPFGEALTRSLENARFDAEAGEAVWEEEDYCTPPLAMERDAILDNYFQGIEVERVGEDEGWSRIEDLPRLWEVESEEITQ